LEWRLFFLEAFLFIFFIFAHDFASTSHPWIEEALNIPLSWDAEQRCAMPRSAQKKKNP
jgi:hypothetical protein